MNEVYFFPQLDVDEDKVRPSAIVMSSECDSRLNHLDEASNIQPDARDSWFEEASVYGARIATASRWPSENRLSLSSWINDANIESNHSWNCHPQHTKTVAHHTYMEPYEPRCDVSAYSLRDTLNTIDRTQDLSTSLSIIPAHPLNNQDTSVPISSAPSNWHMSPQWTGYTFHDTILWGDEKDGLFPLQSLDMKDKHTLSMDRVREDNLIKIGDAPPAPMEKFLGSNNEHTKFPKDPYSPLSVLNRRTSRSGHEMWSTVASIAAATAAYTMNNYTLQRHDLDQSNHPPYASFEALIMHPSPDIFVAASFIHGISTYAYYETRSEDRFRELFLAIGVVSGSAGVLIAGVNVQDMLSGYLPGILILSLILCTGVKMLSNCCARNNSSDKDKEWGGEAV